MKLYRECETGVQQVETVQNRHVTSYTTDSRQRSCSVLVTGRSPLTGEGIFVMPQRCCLLTKMCRAVKQCRLTISLYVLHPTIALRVPLDDSSPGAPTSKSHEVLRPQRRLASSWVVRERLKNSACVYAKDSAIGAREVVVLHFVLRVFDIRAPSCIPFVFG